MKLQVLETIKKYQLISRGEILVLAVSGGVDSMVLLDLFVGFANDFDLTLIVAHLDHAKRSDSMLDASLVRQVAKKCQLVFEEKILPESNKVGNFHAYAREVRYDFFNEVALQHGACKIVTAHHADDHLETLIDHLMKTDVPAGLIGIRPVGDVAGMSVVRPLIGVRKQEIYDYAREFSVEFREDISNASDDYLRNRIRRHIVPLLLEERPDILRHVRNLSDQISADEIYFNQQVDGLLESVAKKGDGYEFSLSWLQQLAISLQRRLLIRLIPGISKGALNELKVFLNNGAPSGVCHVGCGKVVRKSYDIIVVMTAKSSGELVTDFQMKLVLNGENLLPDGRKMILQQKKIFEKQIFDEKNEKNEAQGTYLCYNNIRMPLMVRSRRLGDEIQLINKQGHATVKKIMIDAKVPIDKRNHWPIVVDADEKIIWIPGLKKSPVCLKKPNSSKDLWLEIYE